MTYTVEFLEEAKSDLAELDREVQLAALRVALILRDDPWIGAPLRARDRVGDLSNCRRVSFDRAGWAGKPRYRLVYRSLPDEATIEIVQIVAVGPRQGLEAYRTAAARLRAEMRRRLTSGREGEV